MKITLLVMGIITIIFGGLAFVGGLMDEDAIVVILASYLVAHGVVSIIGSK